MYEEVLVENVWDELEAGTELIVVIFPNEQDLRSRITTTSKISAGFIQQLVETAVDVTKFYKKAGV